jgi:hypothetical protein
MLTVETKVNRDSKSTNERGPSLVGSLDLSCLGCNSRPSTKYLFHCTNTVFQFLVPFAQQAGQAAVPGRLSLSMCLWSTHCNEIVTTEQLTILNTQLLYCRT